MKKIIALVLTSALIACTVSVATADVKPSAFADTSFTFRNGIKWGMAREKVIEQLNEEPNSSTYTYIDFPQDYFYSVSDKEKTDPICWGFYVFGLDLGKPADDEVVLLTMGGTTVTGLYAAVYTLYFNERFDDEMRRERYMELKQQLEKKYGQFTKGKDNWKNRKKVKDGETITEYYLVKKDIVTIRLCISKDATYGIDIYIEYQSPQSSEIEKGLKDGSLYVQTPYGL